MYTYVCVCAYICKGEALMDYRFQDFTREACPKANCSQKACWQKEVITILRLVGLVRMYFHAQSVYHILKLGVANWEETMGLLA